METGTWTIITMEGKDGWGHARCECGNQIRFNPDGADIGFTPEEMLEDHECQKCK